VTMRRYVISFKTSWWKLRWNHYEKFTTWQEVHDMAEKMAEQGCKYIRISEVTE